MTSEERLPGDGAPNTRHPSERHRDERSRDAPIPADALAAYLALYRAGEFWESHEVLEGPWRETGDDFTQGLILLASAWVHWQRGNAHGVRAQLAKTLDRMAAAPDRHMGFDVAAIRATCEEVRRVVEDFPDDWPERVRPLALVPPVAPE